MTLRDTIINAVAGTVVLALGGSIVSLKVNDATQDQKIEQLQTLDANVRTLSNQLQLTNVHLSRVEGQLEGAHDGPRDRSSP